MRWLERRRARRASEEAALLAAQERAWWELCALMHAASGGTPIPYDERTDR